jgi:DNA-binding MarR family transcriptional regulator
MILLRFPVLVRSCWFGLNNLFREKIYDLPLTTVQYTVLRTIYNFGSKKLNQRAIANLIATNKNNLSSIIKRLEAMRYIKIVENPKDKRESKIILSSSGKNIFRKTNKIATHLQENVIQDFREHEIKSLTNYLVRVNESITKSLTRSQEFSKTEIK